MKPTTSARLPVSLVVALALHVLVAVAVPDLRHMISNAVLPAKPAAEPEPEVIRIRLPRNLVMQTELGAMERAAATTRFPKEPLPNAVPARPGTMAMSASLTDAANQAMQAYIQTQGVEIAKRAQAAKAPVVTRVVGELQLAQAPLKLATAETPSSPSSSSRSSATTGPPGPRTQPAPPKPDAGSKKRQGVPAAPKPGTMAKPDETAPAPPKKPALIPEPKTASPPPPASKPAPSPPPPLEYRPPAADQPELIPADDGVVTPTIYGVTDSYRPPAATVTASGQAPGRAEDASRNGSSGIVPPAAAGGLPQAEGAATDAQTGASTANRQDFFQRLTGHLFTVNQLVLAEAIRATSRITIEVNFSIDRDGRVLDAHVARSSGDAALDARAAAVIQRASPVPPLPADMPQQRLQLSFPVQVYR